MGKSKQLQAKAKAKTKGKFVEKEVETIESRLTEAEKKQIKYKTQRQQLIDFAEMAGFEELAEDIRTRGAGTRGRKAKEQQDKLFKFIERKGKSEKYAPWVISEGYTEADIRALRKGKGEEQATTSTAETQPRLVEPRPDKNIVASSIQARIRGQQTRQRQRGIEEAKITREREAEQALEEARRRLKLTAPIRRTTGEEELLATARRRRAEQITRSLEEYPLPEEPPITEEELREALLPERPLPQEPAQWGLDTAQLLGTLATAGATIAGYATPAITAAAAAPLLTTAGVIGTAAAAKVAYDYLYPTPEDVKINDVNEIKRFNNTSINDKMPPLHVYTGVPMDGYTDVDMNKRFIEARNKRQNNILKRRVIMNEGELNKMQYEVAIQDRYNKKMEIEKRLRHVKGIADGDNMTPNTAIMVNY